jgi:hypothetical protein
MLLMHSQITARYQYKLYIQDHWNMAFQVGTFWQLVEPVEYYLGAAEDF